MATILFYVQGNKYHFRSVRFTKRAVDKRQEGALYETRALVLFMKDLHPSSDRNSGRTLDNSFYSTGVRQFCGDLDTIPERITRVISSARFRGSGCSPYRY
jgi:hypothetical protein